MSNDLVPQNGHDQIAMVAHNLERIRQEPLLAMPPEVRPSIFAAWSVLQHVPGLEHPLPISMALATWSNCHGLFLEDVPDIARQLIAPHRMGSYKFASDVMTALAALATEAIRRRAERRDTDSEPGTKLTRDDVRRLIHGVFKDPPKDQTA